MSATSQTGRTFWKVLFAARCRLYLSDIDFYCVLSFSVSLLSSLHVLSVILTSPVAFLVGSVPIKNDHSVTICSIVECFESFEIQEYIWYVSNNLTSLIKHHGNCLSHILFLPGFTYEDPPATCCRLSWISRGLSPLSSTVTLLSFKWNILEYGVTHHPGQWRNKSLHDWVKTARFLILLIPIPANVM